MSAKRSWLERMSGKATEWTGSSAAFAIAAGVILLWISTGPLFGFSDTWQLVINTSTTIVTFLMVFLIQRAQNKDSRAVHLKLNELVASIQGASNRLINAENMSEDDVRILHRHFHRLIELARQEEDLTRSHSIEEAEVDHDRKRKARLREIAENQGRHEGTPSPNLHESGAQHQPGPSAVPSVE